ncbi:MULTISPECIES: hypothetical protein [unclassified Brevundimonas]|uniref:hypothetical protein n=1 Tax=unclassified Brevundimonas TaxID=2622653 RepID=UPI000CFB515F|nr:MULTISPECIES: hypothetical protein [unclassified Brevundimonas]PRB14577.1 hypothetical protein CQ039_09410 [Brevundimonas sp. MYb52]PRB55651.1 hypothetical protein CQ028_01925 [Brevundimonas sp. MYb33]
MNRANHASPHRSAGEIAPMKRKAVITIEYEAEDYLKAMAREKEIRRALVELNAVSDRIDVRFGDRRPRLISRAAAPSRPWPRD